VSFYIQDEWKVRPNFTLSPGLRYENQNNINNDFDFAPRIAFAWSPVWGSKKAAAAPAKPATPATAGTATTATATAPAAPAGPAPPGPPKTVFRGAAGVFYNRISEDITLQSLRFDGIHQQQFLVTDADVLDLFPVVPSIDLLDSFEQPQNRRVKSLNLRGIRSFRFMFTVERLLPKNIKLSVTYFHTRSNRLMRTVNINAPLGGTFIPGDPDSGVRPLGNAAGNIFEYQPSGRTIGNNLNFNVNGNLKALSFWGGYSLGKSRITDSGASGSPFDAYDFSQEWARTPFGSLIFMYGGSSYQAPQGFSVNVFMIASSGQPFNITTGQDTNGDTLFTERPAFATDLSKPGVVITPLGAFDPNPTAGQTIIPRNFGRGPGFANVMLNLAKVFKFGPPIEPKTSPPAGTPRTTDAGAAQTPPPKPPVQRPYSLTFSLNINNIFNRNNQGVPVGNMASPYFLKSASGSNNFFFGPGGGSGGNRTVTLRVRLSF
jgi:hypothetical protein